MNKKSRSVLILIEVIVVLILILGMVLNQTMRRIVEDTIFNGLYLFKTSQESTTTTETIATTTVIATTTTIMTATTTIVATPTIICTPVASGERIFKVSTKSNPSITQVVVNPLDVKKYARQTVNVNIQETNGKSITKVLGTVATDNKTVDFSLSLIQGISSNGTWSGSWLNQDSYCQNYMLTIIATSESGKSKVEMAFK